MRPRCRAHYKNNRASYIARNRRARHRLAEYVRQIKDGALCVDCRLPHPFYRLDFDHVRGVKLFNVSLVGGRTRKQIDEEIAKCDLVCANCHRDRTFNRAARRARTSGTQGH